MTLTLLKPECRKGRERTTLSLLVGWGRSDRTSLKLPNFCCVVPDLIDLSVQQLCSI